MGGVKLTNISRIFFKDINSQYIGFERYQATKTGINFVRLSRIPTYLNGLYTRGLLVQRIKDINVNICIIIYDNATDMHEHSCKP